MCVLKNTYVPLKSTSTFDIALKSTSTIDIPLRSTSTIDIALRSTSTLVTQKYVDTYCICLSNYITPNSLSKQEQILMLGAFALAVRSGQFSDKKNGTLVEGTVRGTISNVVQIFWLLVQQNPTKDADNELSIFLSQQFRAFRNDNPKKEQQKALPFSVLDELAIRQVTKTDKGITQLTIGAAFFACRSCEYSKVPQSEEKYTKLLRLQNIRFFKNGRQLPLQSNDLESADSVAITFEMQKNDMKFDTATHGRTNDSVLCPVLQWARLVSRIWTYPGASLDTNVCTVWQNSRVEHITSKTILQHLRAACATIGSACLGFKPHKIGTHSLCSGAAMEMYLGEIPVYTIMLIGRWSSDAFLRYIRKQVKQFLQNVAKRMLNFHSFRHIPDIHPQRILIEDPPGIHPWRISTDDPRQHNHHNNSETKRNTGRDKSQLVQLPAFSLYT